MRRSGDSRPSAATSQRAGSGSPLPRRAVKLPPSGPGRWSRLSTFRPQRISTPTSSARRTSAACSRVRRTPSPGAAGNSPSATVSPST